MVYRWDSKSFKIHNRYIHNFIFARTVIVTQYFHDFLNFDSFAIFPSPYYFHPTSPLIVETFYPASTRYSTHIKPSHSSISKAVVPQKHRSEPVAMWDSGWNSTQPHCRGGGGGYSGWNSTQPHCQMLRYGSRRLDSRRIPLLFNDDNVFRHVNEDGAVTVAADEVSPVANMCCRC